MKLLPEYIKTDKIKAQVIEHLQDPRRMRIVVIFGIGFIGFVLIGLPLHSKMRTLEEQLIEETKRQEHIIDIQQIKTKDKIYQKHLNKNGTLNWWIEYLLNGSRQYGVKILEFKPYEPKGLDARSGTYQGILFQFRLNGKYNNLTEFVKWVETNKWSMRYTRLMIQRERGSDTLVANMTIAILVNKQEKEEKKAEAGENNFKEKSKPPVKVSKLEGKNVS